MDQVELVAQPRSVTGKKVKRLRRQGIIPLVVYGGNTAPINIQAAELDTRRALAQAGGQLVALRIKGEDKPRMTLARDLQRDVISGALLHVDLHEVDVTQRVEAEVSLALVGQPPPVARGEALLIRVLNTVEVACLPTDIMQSIEVDVSGLAGLDDAVYVKDLALSQNVEVLTNGEEMIAKLEPILEEEEEDEEEEALGIPGAAEVEIVQRGKPEEEQEQT